MNNASNLRIQIFDISGRKVVEITEAKQNETITVFNAGVYVVKVGCKSTKISLE